MTKDEIVDMIYKAYGTDSGILFGIKERSIVEAIVEFTINRIVPAPTETFGCLFCDKTFTDEYKLETHVNLNHKQAHASF